MKLWLLKPSLLKMKFSLALDNTAFIQRASRLPGFGIGANRFVWNQFVAAFEARYQANPELKFPKIGLLKSWLPLMRKEHDWLKKANSTSLQCGLF